MLIEVSPVNTHTHFSEVTTKYVDVMTGDLYLYQSMGYPTQLKNQTGTKTKFYINSR